MRFGVRSSCRAASRLRHAVLMWLWGIIFLRVMVGGRAGR